MNSLSTEAILKLLNPDQQKELFYALEMIIAPAENSIQEKLKKLEGKYSRLVWLARKYPEDFAIPGVQKAYDKLLEDYPKEVDDLEQSEDGWVHGFNSGALAIVRLLEAYSLPHNHREVMPFNEDDDSEGDIFVESSKPIEDKGKKSAEIIPIDVEFMLPFVAIDTPPGFQQAIPPAFRFPVVPLVERVVPPFPGRTAVLRDDDSDTSSDEEYGCFPYEPVVTKDIEIRRAEKVFPWLDT